jgi:hypothetical protein
MKFNRRAAFEILAALVFATIVIAYLLPHEVRPPWPVQREEQRRIISERVESIGGWDVLRKDCIALLQNEKNEFVWPSSTNEFAPVFAKLKPREVKAYPDTNGVIIMRMKFFGMHSTGSRGTPYYGLWIVCSSNSDNYVPKLDFGENTMTGVISPITNSIFEIY